MQCHHEVSSTVGKMVVKFWFKNQQIKWKYVLCFVNRNNIWSWQNLGRILENEFIKVKVEKILKGCLDWIPSSSPSVKSQIMDRKACLRCKGKSLLGVVNKLSKTIFFWHHPAMFCLITTSKLSSQLFEFSLMIGDGIESRLSS